MTLCTVSHASSRFSSGFSYREGFPRLYFLLTLLRELVNTNTVTRERVPIGSTVF